MTQDVSFNDWLCLLIYIVFIFGPMLVPKEIEPECDCEWCVKRTNAKK